MRTLQKTFMLILLLALLAPAVSFADSPLTSTPFADAYMDVKMVKYAASKKTVDKKIAAFLMNANTPLAHKAAVVNAIGWDFNGQNNAGKFMVFLQKKYSGLDWENYDMLTGGELMCLGYFKAMDNYFEPQGGAVYTEAAAKMLPGSYTVQMVNALVQAQIVFDSNWCDVWKVVDKVDTNTRLTRDMNAEAVKIIIDYIILYKDECK